MYSPTATLYAYSCPKDMSEAYMKSPHGAINAIIIVKMIIGFAIGIIILKNTLLLETPSILAASSSDLGIVSNNPFAI